MADASAADPGYTGLVRPQPTLERAMYVEPAAFERDLQAIWYRNWIYVCQSSELPSPRDYRLLEVGDQQLIVLRDEAGFTVSTTPGSFGPVYYKRQDMTNFVFQLANMDQALKGGDFHAPVEPMRYFFQVRIGDTAGGPTRLLDPARYIEGHKSHMIRSEETGTPLSFQAEEFAAGEVVLIDFMRLDTLPPDTVFTAERENLSSLATTQERVVYALAVETPPTPEELGQLTEGTGAVD